MVLIDFEVIGDDAKLLARHFENVVLIDAQRRTHRFGGAEKGAPKSGICACCPASSNRIRGRNRTSAVRRGPLRRRGARSISFLMQDAEHESVAELTFIWSMCDTRMLTRLILNCAHVFQVRNSSHLGLGEKFGMPQVCRLDCAGYERLA